MIASRGTKVFPPTGAITDNVDELRCRLMLRDATGDLSDAVLIDALQRIGKHFRWGHVEKLSNAATSMNESVGGSVTIAEQGMVPESGGRAHQPAQRGPSLVARLTPRPAK